MNDKKCLVVDASYLPRSIITSKRAFVIKYKGNAEVVANHPTYFQTANKDVAYPKPSIIRVYRNIRLEYHKVPLTRTNIYKRDNYECVYCGNSDRSMLTLDHVVPRSKGGKDAWDNLVTSCYDCNQAKADLTIEEWGREDPKPRRPHNLMLMKSINYIPKEWEPFLFS